MVALLRSGCLRRWLKHCFGNAVLLQHSPMRASFPILLVGMIQAKNPGAMLLPR